MNLHVWRKHKMGKKKWKQAYPCCIGNRGWRYEFPVPDPDGGPPGPLELPWGGWIDGGVLLLLGVPLISELMVTEEEESPRLPAGEDVGSTGWDVREEGTEPGSWYVICRGCPDKVGTARSALEADRMSMKETVALLVPRTPFPPLGELVVSSDNSLTLWTRPCLFKQ